VEKISNKNPEFRNCIDEYIKATMSRCSVPVALFLHEHNGRCRSMRTIWQ